MKAHLQLLASAIVVVAAVSRPAAAQLPTGAQVVHGNVAITQAGGAMNIQQASQNAIVNWQSFDIGGGNSVRLEQGGANAAMLARVVGGDASQLLGSLKADGKLFLINQRGIVVGENAVIDTAGFLGSTLNVTDAEFLAGGAMTFRGESGAGIINLGTITAREGNVMLFAHSVKNAGEIAAGRGTVGLGAGTEVLLASPNADGFVIKANLSTPAEKTGVDNAGVIVAAQAQLGAAGGSIYELAVNQSGVVRATGSEVRNGRVLLTAGGGVVGVSGEVRARNADGSGGEILVGGDYRGENVSVANAARTVVTSTARLDASAADDAGAAGRVIVWADGATRFLGSLKATGAGGGFAEVSGKRWLDFNPASTVQLGRGGTLLLDPDALIISDGETSGVPTSGTDPFAFNVAWEVDVENLYDFELPPPSILNVTTLQEQLAVSNVILDTSTAFGHVSFEAPVTWENDNTLTVRSGNGINIGADITGGANSALELYTGIRAWGMGELGFPPIDGEASIAADATIKVGTLVYGANPFAQYPEEVYTPEGDRLATGFLLIDGNIDVNTLVVDLSGGDAGVSTFGANNTIRAFRAEGSGLLSAYLVNHHGDLDLTFDSTRSDAFYVQFYTPGNLTLTNGSDFDFERPDDSEWSGNIILGSTDGGAFVNEAGADVFGDKTRFLIYTSTTSATNKGGLTDPSIQNVFNHPFDEADDFGEDRISRFFFSALSGAPLLTYKADSFSRTYAAANSPFTFTRQGLLDEVADDVTGTPSLSSSATQSSGVGVYAINIGQGTLESSNYDFEFENGTLTIERAPLTVTANDKTRRIDLANPAFDATFSGFVLDQDVSVLGGTLAFDTDAVPASPAGEYEITPSGLTSANYEITFLPGTLTLTEFSTLIISANNFSRSYGSANPTFTASFDGFVGGETEAIVTGLQFDTEATQSSGIGNYTITPFGATAAGYEIDYESGTLTIERAPLTISVPNQSHVYGDATELVANFNGLVNGETSSVVSGLSLATGATPASGVGNYAITASGAAADNYAITYAVGSLTITPAALTVAIDPATRRYGDADPVFTYTVRGLKNGDPASLVSVANLSSLAPADAGIGAYGIIGFPWVSSSNYTVSAQATGSLTITPRPLTVVADSASRVYGDANPPLTATFTGLASFDSPALFGDLGLTTQATQSSGVGEWGITFRNLTHPNYAITSQFGTLTITPAPLTFQSLVELSRVYGRANPDMPLPAVDGLKLADTAANLGLAFETPALTADAGTYTYRLTATNPNYELAPAAGLFRIDPAPLTVAITPTGRLYGEANPASYEFTANGLAFGQSAASVLSVRNSASVASEVGVHALVPVLTTGNYVITSIAGGTFQINPRVITLDLPYYARYYGDLDPGFFNGDIVVGGDGLASFDTIDSLIPELRTATPTTSLSNTGYYRIDPTFAANPNYRYSWSPGYLAIMPRPVEITVGSGVSFGNNNVPEDFRATPDIALITFGRDHPSGTGYNIEISNVPPGVDLAELLKHVAIVHGDENTPQPVHTAVALDQVPFPPRPNRTPPVASDEPVPEENLGIITVELTQYVPESPATPSSLEALPGNVIFNGGQLIFDPTGTKKDERFADVIRYLLPRPSLGGNYVVTAIQNGKLTMKADPIVVKHTLDAEAAYKRLKDAREALLNGVTGANGSVQRTFNLPQSEFPLIQEAFANLLFDLIQLDRENPLLQELSGLSSVVSLDQISPDAMVLWLSDIHTNSYKQRMLLPAMTAYGVKVAGLSPSERSPLQQKLVERMIPSLEEARNDLIDRAQAAQTAWADMQYGNTSMTTLTGAEVPYEKFVSSAVQKTVEDAYDFKQMDGATLSETEMSKLLGLGAAAGGGITAGGVMAKIAMSSMDVIFPRIRVALAKAANDAAKTALQAAKVARTGQTANAVFGIVSVAVSIGIEKAIAVANEGEQAKKFNALVNSRNDPIDPYKMADTDQGRAVLAAGLMTMFGGG